MWPGIITMDNHAFGRLKAIWFSPDGHELLLLAGGETSYWDLSEKRPLWTIREEAGGDGLSPDGRVYRDLASGLFYPLLGAHGGRQLRGHPAGGRITVNFGTPGLITVTDPGGQVHPLSQRGDFGDWIVAGFCETGQRIFVAGPRRLAVFAHGLSIG